MTLRKTLFYIWILGVLGPSSHAATPTQCDVWVDSQGISHVRGADEAGAIACLGYLHGRDRAWQADHLRRIVIGKRAEIYGKNLIRGDFIMRLLGLAERAQALYQGMKPKDQLNWAAYAVGINRGFKAAQVKGVYEFKALGYEPEPWEPWHSIAVLLLQSFDQTKKNFESQKDEQNRKDIFGESAAHLFSDAGLPWSVAILKDGEYPARSGARSSGATGDSGEGSNNWVVAPSRSQSGNAWLANDPHLTLKYPPFWYWTHISGGGLDAMGGSIPGIPIIVAGTNRYVSWGLTNSYLDVAEEAQVLDTELKNAKTTRPTIQFKWGPFTLPFLFKTFRRTPGGLPVMPTDAAPGKAHVLWWSGFVLEPGDFEGLFSLMKAHSSSEMDLALSKAQVPSWNYVFADTKGKIGFRSIGKMPKWASPKTYGISDQSLSEMEKIRPLLAPDLMPHVLAPKRGFIATANNQQWLDGPFYMGRSQTQSFRAFRIEELIQASPKHDLESLRALQCDLQAVDARFLLPLMLKKAVTEKGTMNARERKVLGTLSEWDFWTSEDCKACAVYRLWVDGLMEDKNESVLYRELSDKRTKIEVRPSLVAALDDLHVTDNGTLPRWGDLHLAAFPHLAGGGLFKARAISTPGDKHSVNPGTFEWDGKIFSHTSGASERMIVEMSIPPRIYSVLAGENQDVASRDPTREKSGWHRWVGCELEKRIFPIDLSKAHWETVDLH